MFSVAEKLSEIGWTSLFCRSHHQRSQAQAQSIDQPQTFSAAIANFRG